MSTLVQVMACCLAAPFITWISLHTILRNYVKHTSLIVCSLRQFFLSIYDGTRTHQAFIHYVIIPNTSRVLIICHYNPQYIDDHLLYHITTVNTRMVPYYIMLPRPAHTWYIIWYYHRQHTMTHYLLTPPPTPYDKLISLITTINTHINGLVLLQPCA